MFLMTLLFPGLTLGETMGNLVERDGLYYKEFTDVPFTGTVTGRYQGNVCHLTVMSLTRIFLIIPAT
jgi:hypothetical protein